MRVDSNASPVGGASTSVVQSWRLMNSSGVGVATPRPSGRSGSSRVPSHNGAGDPVRTMGGAVVVVVGVVVVAAIVVVSVGAALVVMLVVEVVDAVEEGGDVETGAETDSCGEFDSPQAPRTTNNARAALHRTSRTNEGPFR